jgi:hypothetical protein
MLLMTLSAGVIIHSLPLTKFAVTEHYQVCPGILKKNISTQKSTLMDMEDCGGAAVVLVECSNAAALGSDVGRWFKIAVAGLGGSGGRRACNDGVGISVVKADGLYYNIGISVGKDC